MHKRIPIYTLAAIVGSTFMLAGCSKKAAKAVPPAAPPPAAAPSATLAANPDVIQQGQSTELSWTTSNAGSVSIEGLGTVSASGSRSVAPGSSTTYTLTAQGPGGTQQVSTRVTVNPNVARSTSGPSEADLFEKNVKDVFFDYDKADVRSDQVPAVNADASFLAGHPDIKILIAGHCDDRGSEEYNLALGDSRANAMKTSLLAQGVSGDQIKTVSLGKEHPFCSEDNEQCWRENRRDHLSPQQ